MSIIIIAAALAAGCTADGLDVSESSISDMSEIRYFTHLTKLFCYSNSLTQLDVSNNLSLAEFECYNNPLEKLILAEQHKNMEWYTTVSDEYSSVLDFDAQ